MLQAYDQLSAEGYLTGSVGSGTYVARDLPEERVAAKPQSAVPLSSYTRRAREKKAPERAPLPYDFVYGLSPPDEITIRQWQRWIRKASENLPLDYGPTQGESALREALGLIFFGAEVYRAAPIKSSLSAVRNKP